MPWVLLALLCIALGDVAGGAIGDFLHSGSSKDLAIAMVASFGWALFPALVVVRGARVVWRLIQRRRRPLLDNLGK